MSNLIGHEKGGNERPTEGVRGIQEKSPINADVASDGSEEDEIKEPLPLGTKRKRSPSSEEQCPPKRTKPIPELGTGSFRNMRHPSERMPCVVSVDQHEPIGSFYPADNGFAIMLFIDPGRYGPPTISLGFRNSGTKTSKDLSRNTWDTQSNVRGQWAMNHIEHGYATPDAADPRMSNPHVLALCGIQDMGELLYMRFESWHQALGFHAKDAFKDQSTGIRKSLKTMFQPSKPYSLELWFVATFKATDFRKHCLRYFSYSLEQRVHPLSHWKDINGDYFTDRLVVLPPKILADREHGRMMLRMPAATRQGRLAETKVSRSQHIGAAQCTVAGGGGISGQVE